MANNHFKGVASWSLPNGSIAQNIFHGVLVGGDALAASLKVDILGAHWASVLSPWLPMCTPSTLLSNVRVYEFDETTNTSLPLGLRAIGLAGTGGGSPLPAGNACKINLFPPMRPRPAGMYLPAPERGQVSLTGTIAAPAVLAALGVASDAVAEVALNAGSNAFVPAYYSKKEGGLVLLRNSTLQMNTAFDYIRSRKDGVGI